MKLHANDLRLYLKDKARPAWVFNSASEQDTAKLGTVFACVVEGALSENTRIGLCGSINLGKSAFAYGAINAIRPKAVIEETDDPRHQGRWVIAGRQSIRHYDAGYSYQEWSLPSYYRNEDMRSAGLPHTDMVEHPECDNHNREFDCLVSIERDNAGWESRLITVMPTDALAGSGEFQSFVKAANPYIAEHRVGKPNSVQPFNPFSRFTL